MKNSQPVPPPRGRKPNAPVLGQKRAAAPRAEQPRPAAAARPRRDPLRRKKAVRPWWYGFLVAVGLMLVVAAGGVGAFLAIIYNMSTDDPLEDYTPGEVTRIYDRDGGRLIGEFRDPDGEQRILVRLEDIPKKLQDAFLAIEDARFYNHFGVDTIGVIRAFYKMFTGSGFEGASTVTMQIPRNMNWLGREQTWTRKIKEAFLAVWIERHYSKSQILEVYLNQINLGGNVCGVRLAAEKYFSKSLDDLTLAECALLAAIPKSPTAYNPLLHPDAARERRNIVLRRMFDLGLITDQQYEQSRQEAMILHPGKRELSAGSLYPYFVDGLETDLKRFYREELIQLYDQLQAKKAGGGAPKKSRRTRRIDPVQQALQLGGLRLTSTIDPQIQEICQRTLRQGLIDLEKVWQERKDERQTDENKKWDGRLQKGDVKLMRITKVGEDELKVSLSRYRGTVERPQTLPFYNPEMAIKVGQLLDVEVTEVDDATGEIKGKFADIRPMQGSLVVLDAHTAEVLAIAGGAGFAGEHSGWVNQAMANSRQMGSCFKPFFYGAAMEKGYQPNDMIVDEPIAFDNGTRGEYKPINYEKRFFGPQTLIEGLEHSRNVTTIRLFEALRIPKALEVVRKFDFAYGYNNPTWKIDPYVTSCLGTVSSSPFVLASAYQVFANGGMGVRPQFFKTIVDTQGRPPFPVKRPEYEVLKQMSAYQTTYMMRQVVEQIEDRATGWEVGKTFPFPKYPRIAGKTGTTTKNRDAWFVGYTPDLVIVSQVGFDPWRPMGPKMTGGTTAGHYIWIPAFKEIMKTRRSWKLDFDQPEEGVEMVDICGSTGKRVGDGCGGHKVFHKVPFAPGKAPKAYCNGGGITPLIAPMDGGGDWGMPPSLPQVRGMAHRPYSGYDFDTE